MVAKGLNVALESSGAAVRAESKAALILQDAAWTFDKPSTVAEALPRLLKVAEAPPEKAHGFKYDSSKLRDFIEDLDPKSKLAQTRVDRVLGTGGMYTIALGSESGTAVKLSTLNMLRRPITNPAFDAPLLEHGRMGHNLHYTVQPIGETAGVQASHVREVVQAMRREGYIDFDMGIHNPRLDQVALFGAERKPLLIDQPAAVPAYGSQYENGLLIPHPAQLDNLKVMRQIIGDKDVPSHGFDSVALRELKYRFMDFKLTPTEGQDWTMFEVLNAVRSLAREREQLGTLAVR